MVRPRARALFLAAVIIFAGVLVAAALAMPRENTILQSVHRPSARELGRAFLSAVVRPDETFSHLLPGVVPSAVAAALLTLASIGLVNRPNLFLAALEAQIAFGIFFRVVYPGAYRHEGLFLMFLVFLYWIFLESRDAQARLVSLRHRPLLFRAGLSIALLALILANLARSRIVWADVRLERSSSKALAAFLSQSNEYSTAIIVPEPDFLLESLPYYASNPIYLPRERRFGKTVSWTTESQPRLSLSEVLKSAYEIRTRYGRPVLIALGWWDVESSPPGEKKYILGKVFSWSDDELAAFRRSTVFVAEFNAPLGDESYKVYALAK